MAGQIFIDSYKVRIGSKHPIDGTSRDDWLSRGWRG